MRIYKENGLYCLAYDGPKESQYIYFECDVTLEDIEEELDDLKRAIEKQKKKATSTSERELGHLTQEEYEELLRPLGEAIQAWQKTILEPLIKRAIEIL